MLPLKKALVIAEIMPHDSRLLDVVKEPTLGVFAPHVQRIRQRRRRPLREHIRALPVPQRARPRASSALSLRIRRRARTHRRRAARAGVLARHRRAQGANHRRDRDQQHRVSTRVRRVRRARARRRAAARLHHLARRSRPSRRHWATRGAVWGVGARSARGCSRTDTVTDFTFSTAPVDGSLAPSTPARATTAPRERRTRCAIILPRARRAIRARWPRARASTARCFVHTVCTQTRPWLRSAGRPQNATREGRRGARRTETHRGVIFARARAVFGRDASRGRRVRRGFRRRRLRFFWRFIKFLAFLGAVRVVRARGRGCVREIARAGGVVNHVGCDGGARWRRVEEGARAGRGRGGSRGGRGAGTRGWRAREYGAETGRQGDGGG